LRRAFCLTLFYGGCRISEALSVTVNRIDWAEKTIVFETLKQRRRGCFRAVPIPDMMCRLLRQFVVSTDPSARVWPFSRATGYRLVKGYMKTAQIKGSMASPKGLRHGFAVACLGRNVPLPVVQKWLGHAKLETTAIYLQVLGNEERKLAKRVWAAD
jgi:integrase/recombinase XerD